MTITPEGLNLIQDAMTDLGMEHSVVATGATKQYWIDELNFPNPVKLKTMLTQSLEMKVDWLWIDQTAKHSITNDFLPEIMNIATILKDRGATAFVFLWGKAAEHWKQDMEQIAHLCSTIFAGWQQLRHTIENSFCGGPVCRQTRFLLVLPMEVASFYDEAIQDKSTYQEPPTGMSTCLDSSNTVYSDYLQGYTQSPSDRKTINVQHSEYYPVVESMVQWRGESFPTWITTSPAPDLADSSVTTQGDVYISTADMHMPSAV
jgi:hypothetical protein